MAKSDMEDAWQRAVDLNLRYYTAAGKLALDYMLDLVNAVTDIQAKQTDTSKAAGPAAAPRAATPQMVLEAAAGEDAVGAFLVENSLSEKVETSVVAGSFTEEAGKQAKVKFVFDPSTVTLQPGEQMLVRVRVRITQNLKSDVRYYGEFLIPAIRGTRIPVVLKRRPAS
ncbi:MAG: hypothetical protein ACRES7_10995 [Gammaproteobacteria bacterium]